MAEDDTGESLKALISRARDEGTRMMTDQIRHRVVRYAERQRQQGHSLKVTATELGVSFHTLSYWRSQAAGTKKKLRRVEVVDEASKGITLHGLHGTRVEGLTIADVAELLRRLG